MDPTPTQEQRDDRAAPRQRVLLAGRMVYGDADLTVNCAIRDLSESGARVRISSAVALPSRVRLIEVKTGRAFECEVAWRRMPEIGLKFIGPALDLANTDSRELWMLRRVWLEAVDRYSVPEGIGGRDRP